MDASPKARYERYEKGDLWHCDFDSPFKELGLGFTCIDGWLSF